MTVATIETADTAMPKRPRGRRSYNENVDEPAKLIDQEPVEIEEEVPADETEPVERIEDDKKRDTPAFDE